MLQEANKTDGVFDVATRPPSDEDASAVKKPRVEQVERQIVPHVGSALLQINNTNPCQRLATKKKKTLKAPHYRVLIFGPRYLVKVLI